MPVHRNYRARIMNKNAKGLGLYILPSVITGSKSQKKILFVLQDITVFTAEQSKFMLPQT